MSLVNKVQPSVVSFCLTDIKDYVIIVSQGHRSSGLRGDFMTLDAMAHWYSYTILRLFESPVG